MQAQTNPQFSIIVPVYRVEAYLETCLDSILAQTVTDYEVILVDDGSPDRSGAICDDYARRDSRFRVIHKENGGLVSARKAGARVCAGRYVLNVDSDDYIAPELLERLSEIIRRHDPDAVTFDGYRFAGESLTDFRGTVPAGLYAGADLEVIRRNLIQNDALENAIVYGICLKAVRRELYLPCQLAVPQTISIGEDLAVTGPLLAHCRRVYVSDIRGYYYRDNPKSIMNTFRKDEAAQIKTLAAFLLEAMGEAYREKIDIYVLLHYFDFLDRAMVCLKGLEPYRALAAETADEELLACLRRAKCPSSRPTDRLVFWLMNRQRFTALWFLRRLKKRKGGGL